MLFDTIFYFYGVKIMKNIDNKVKLDTFFKDLNFNVYDYQLSLLVVLYGNR